MSAHATDSADPAGDTRAPPTALSVRSHDMRSWIGGHPVLTVLLVAFVARAAVAIVIAIISDGFLFEDDHGYAKLARDWIEGRTGTWNDYASSVWEQSSAFLIPLTAAYWLFGSATLAGQLLVALAGAAAAAMACRLLLEVVPVERALVGGTILALFPSQVLWSSVTLKDAFVWLTLTGIAFVATSAGRAERWTLVRWLVLLLGLLVVVANLRDHTLVVTAWSLAATAWCFAPSRRLLATAVAVALAVFVPLAAGIGPGGIDLVRDTAPNLAALRAAGAAGADTSVTEPADDGTANAPDAHGESQASRDDGRVTAGVAAGPDDDAAGANIRYLPRGLTVMFLLPLPWADLSNSRVRLALAEHILWYPLLVAAVIGLATGLRHRRVLAFPFVLGLGLATMWGLVEGNFGTAYRHRGEFVWVVVVLATVGADVVVRRSRSSGRSAL